MDGGYSDHILVPDSRYLAKTHGIEPKQLAPLACSGLTAFSSIKKCGISDEDILDIIACRRLLSIDFARLLLYLSMFAKVQLENIMQYREFGKTGFKLSVIGMGTYYDAGWIASAMILRYRAGKKEKIAALQVGLDLGINFIDTAEIYQSEPLVGEAIKGRKRDELFIATKVWGNHLRSHKLVKACKKSLSKLGLSYVDLYQIHFPSSRVPINETMGAMEQLVGEGLIRNIGISNFSLSQMIDAEQALKKYTLTSTQLEYNFLKRDVEKEILPHCEKEKIAMIPWFPLAHGKMSKKKSDAITKICADRKISSTQLALAWLVTRSPMNFPIPRASRAGHVKEDTLAGDVMLTPEEMKALG